MALRGRRDPQPSPQREMGAPVVDVAFRPGRFSQGEREVDELHRAVVAVAALGQPGEAEVAGRLTVARGDDVPARPSPARVVERGQPLGELERVVERGRGGGDQPDVLGGRREVGPVDGRLELGGVGRPGGSSRTRPPRPRSRAPRGSRGQAPPPRGAAVGSTSTAAGRSSRSGPRPGRCRPAASRIRPGRPAGPGPLPPRVSRSRPRRRSSS